jgi:hypothetical protein
MIAGEDILAEESDNLNAYVKLQKFIAHANGHESLHAIIKKISFDFKLQGAYALHLIWNNERTEIAEIYHVPVERVRAGRPNAFGKIDKYYISADWGNTRQNKPAEIPAFNINDRTSPSQLLYTGSYSPNMDVYFTPDYLAGCNWALVDQRVAEFHLNNISNSFSGSYVFSFANGVPTQEERFQIENSITQKFTSSGNAGKFILTFSDDKTRTPEVTPITTADLDKQYLALQELLVQNILTAHRVTSPMLMGIKSDTGLGSNVDELNAASEFYQNTVVRPFQQNILKTLRTILEVNQINLPLEFVQLKPITTKWTVEDMKSVMTQAEIREELGLAPLEQEEEVVEEEFEKAGMIDGKPVYSTKEEAIAEAEKLGCSGYHEHEYEGQTVYMACENHDELMNFSKTELEAYLETLEDIPEDWELIDEEIVDGEHESFDFEEVLNEIANDKLELASTGRANPNARSAQDGLNESGTNFYKVRYVYTNDNRLVNKSGTSRDFCKLMTSANKIYRKEDIIKMNRMAVNAGFGPRGAATYSIWFYKGGPECQHYFKRLIYKAPPSDENFVVYPDNITDNQLISYTQARSQGFTAEQNDNLVATAPKRMKNHGYLNPR